MADDFHVIFEFMFSIYRAGVLPLGFFERYDMRGKLYNYWKYSREVNNERV